MRENNTVIQINTLCRGRPVVGRLGSIWPAVSKLKVNTGFFTNDLVNFPYIFFGLLYLAREIWNVFASGPCQSNLNTGTTYHLKYRDTLQPVQPLAY